MSRQKSRVLSRKPLVFLHSLKSTSMRSKSMYNLWACFLIVHAVCSCAFPCLAFAEESSTSSGMAGFIIQTIWFVLMGVMLMYVIVWHPQKNKQVQQVKFIESLKKGDSVQTSGGIQGKVVAVRDESISLELSKGLKVLVSKEHVHPTSSQGSNVTKKSTDEDEVTNKS